jgi:hypothetical protein
MTDVAGWVGMVLVISGFALLSMRRLKPRSARYQLLNTVGAGLLVVSTLATASWPAVWLNAAWCAIGGVTLLMIARERWSASGLTLSSSDRVRHRLEDSGTNIARSRSSR